MSNAHCQYGNNFIIMFCLPHRTAYKICARITFTCEMLCFDKYSAYIIRCYFFFFLYRRDSSGSAIVRMRLVFCRIELSERFNVLGKFDLFERNQNKSLETHSSNHFWRANMEFPCKQQNCNNNVETTSFVASISRFKQNVRSIFHSDQIAIGALLLFDLGSLKCSKQILTYFQAPFMNTNNKVEMVFGVALSCEWRQWRHHRHKHDNFIQNWDNIDSTASTFFDFINYSYLVNSE